MNSEKFSVLMSVYIKEKPEYFKDCMDSIFKQTVVPNEIVLVYDGPISKEIEKMVIEYNRRYNGIIKVKSNEVNKGLGLALADGIPICSNEIIARMDTDDVCRNDRFEKQWNFLLEHPEVDIVGSNILEFNSDINDIIGVRCVPVDHNDIVRYQKKRSAFNHMTVMMKKEAVLKAGNYKNVPLMEDDMLWTDMIMSGARCANICENLVYARVGAGMIERRGGFSYFLKYRNGKRKILQTGFISYLDYLETLFIQFIVSLMPVCLRKIFFYKCLRQNKNDKD